jgi:SHS family lactate transporter-like MFS transporter
VLQEGYVVGYLFAALVYGTLFPILGWRGMFVVGALPAFLVIYIRKNVAESPAWVKGRTGNRPQTRLSHDIRAHWKRFLFLVVLMFGFNSFSHGTQDLYPTFLEKNLGFSPQQVRTVSVIASIGALLGGIVFGTLSERMGRRRAIIIAALLALPMIPLWVYSRRLPMLALGGFLMQFMVQGAWGVIPAHLNELSPGRVRGTFPGLAYQVGNLLSSGNAVMQARLVERKFSGSSPPILAWTVVLVAVLVAVVTAAGREQRGVDLSQTDS